MLGHVPDPHSSHRRRRIARVLGALALVALFVALRAPAMGRSYWLDEVLTLGPANSRPSTMVETLAAHDFHPPLYYYLVRRWWRLGDSADEVWIRTLSMLAGLVTVVATGRIAFRMVSERAGWTAAFLAAVTWPLVWTSFEARNYATMNAFSALAWLATVAALQRGAWWRWGLVAVALAASWYSFYYAAHAAVALGVFVLLARPRARDLAGLAAAGAIALALFAPWMPYLGRQMERVTPSLSGGIVHFEPDAASVGAVLEDLGVDGTPWAFLGVRGTVAVAALALGAAAFVLLRRRGGSRAAPSPAGADRPWARATVGLFVAFAAAVVVLGMAGAPVRERYLAYGGVISSVLLAIALARARPVVAFAVVAGVVVLLGAASARHRARKHWVQDWRAAAAWIEARAREGDTVGSIAWWTKYPVEFYVRASGPPDVPVVGIPFEVPGVREIEGVETDVLRDEHLAAVSAWLSAHDRFFLVRSHTKVGTKSFGDERLIGWLAREGWQRVDGVDPEGSVVVDLYER
jgi:hypothetical protein